MRTAWGPGSEGRRWGTPGGKNRRRRRPRDSQGRSFGFLRAGLAWGVASGGSPGGEAFEMGWDASERAGLGQYRGSRQPGGVTLERGWECAGWRLGGAGPRKEGGALRVPSESVARAGTHLLQPHAEAAEHLLHVAPLLHGDDSEVVLLVHPHQEALVVIVPRVGCRERPRNQPRGDPVSLFSKHVPTARGQRAEGQEEGARAWQSQSLHLQTSVT